MPLSEWVPVEFAGGIWDKPFGQTETPVSDLAENWHGRNGLLLPRQPWAVGPSAGTVPSVKKGRGIHTQYTNGFPRILVVNYQTGTDYLFHTTDELGTAGTPGNATTWSAASGTLTITSPYHYLYVDAVQAAYASQSWLVLTNPGLGSTQLRRVQGTSIGSISGSEAGRTVAYHHSRVWTGGSVANPTTLFFSAPGLGETWDLVEQAIPVGKLDGEPIECLLPYGSGLLIGKRSSLWWLGGDTTDTFALRPLSVGQGQGCAAGRAMIATDYGVVICGADGNVWLWDGDRPYKLNPNKRLPKQTMVAATSPAVAESIVTMAYVDDRVFIQIGTETYVYDFRERAWWYESQHNAATDAVSVIGQLRGHLMGQPINGSSYPPMLFRPEDGQHGTDFYYAHDNDGTRYRFRTTEIKPRSPLGKATLKGAYLRVRLFGDTPTVGLTMTPRVDGADVTTQAKTWDLSSLLAGSHEHRYDFAATDGRYGAGVTLEMDGRDLMPGPESILIAALVLHYITDEGPR
jgi:hypothetical protein